MSAFEQLSRDMDKLGNIMKMFESNTQATLVPGQPIVMRFDGKNFSSFTKGLVRPYDKDLRLCMVKTMEYAVKIWNASVGYTQSDEITLVFINGISLSGPQLSTAPFSSRVQKIVSINAAKISTYFNKMLEKHLPAKAVDPSKDYSEIDCPVFDARAFNVPDLEWASLALLWREQDCTKNAITQAAQCVYSHKELMNKGSKVKIDMMHQKGVNFSEYPDAFKRGVFVIKKKKETTLSEDELKNIPEKFHPKGPIIRGVWETGSLARLAGFEYPTLGAILFDETTPIPFTEFFYK